MLTIYHWEPNANSGKPILAACEKGVDFESRYIDMLAFDQHKPDYVAINPAGTIPAMVHDGTLIAESTAMIEYIDETFPGPPLRPNDPFERWRMRWWCRFFDQFVGPSASMVGWSTFVGPRVRKRDPAELAAAIERIPLKERRVAWSKAIYGQFSEEELAESRARVVEGIAAIEAALATRPWIAGGSYSMADLAGFMMLFALPRLLPEQAKPERAPRFIDWLQRINARPATQLALTKGHQDLADRFNYLNRQ